MKIRYILLIFALLAGGYALVGHKNTPAEKKLAEVEKTLVKKDDAEKGKPLPKAERTADGTLKLPDSFIDKSKETVQAGNESLPVFAIACKDLSEKMLTCEPFTCKASVEGEPGFVLVHEVAGKQEDGTCLHTQSAPNDMKVVCRYSDEMRLLVAKNMQIPHTEALTPEEGQYMSAGFNSECEVFSNRTGQKINRELMGGDENLP